MPSSWSITWWSAARRTIAAVDHERVPGSGGVNLPVSPARRAPRRARLRLTPLTLVAGILLLLQAVVRGWVVTRSYYFQDDFAHLDMARREGLSWDYLVRDYGGHLETGQYLVIWLLSHVIDGSFAPAAVSILVLQALASGLLFQLLRSLFGDSPLILVPWTVYLFTPLAVGWSSWWAASLQTLPLQIATVTVLLTSVRAHRQRSRMWAFASVVAFACGLAMWEKAGLILPVAVAVHLLIVLSPRPWGARLRSLWSNAGMWVAHAVVLAVYVAMYLSVVDEGLGQDRDESFSVGRLLELSLFRTFLPGLFGGPWHGDGAESTIFPYTDMFPALVFLGAFLTLVALSFLVTGRRAYEGWLLLVGYLAADLALLGLGRADWAEFLARDPRYFADALPITAMALLAAFRGLVDSPVHLPTAAWLRPRLTLPVVMRVVALLVVSCLVTTVRMAPAVQHDYSANYTRGIIRDMTTYPRRSVVNGTAPYEISARADITGMMNAMGQDFEFDQPAPEMYIFDGLAQMRLVDVFPGSEVTQGPEEGCGWSVGDTKEQLGYADAYSDAPRVLRVGYYAEEPAHLSVTVAGETQGLSVEPGLRRAYFVIGDEAGPITAVASDVDEFCITDYAIGAAWVATDPATQP